jgi:polar amino acid transport system substrate-binding protein
MINKRRVKGREMRNFIFFIALLFFAITKSWGEPLKVGVIPSPPFVIAENTTYSGIAVELWDYIAQGLQTPYKFIEFSEDKTEDALKALGEKKIDVLVGPVSVTQNNHNHADFSLPFYIDKIVPLVYQDYIHDLPKLLSSMMDSVGWVVVFFILLFALYLWLLWYYENRDTDAIPSSCRKGVSYLFWIHILLGWHSNEIPKRLPVKILLLLKTTAFYIIFTLLSSAQISYLTMLLVIWSDPIQEFSDLEKKRVGAVADSRPLKLGKNLGLRVVSFDSLEEGVQALENEQVGAFLSDLSLADSYLKGSGKENINISHFVLKHDLYAFATRPNDPILRKINEQMLVLRKDEIPVKICRNHLEQGIKACEL